MSYPFHGIRAGTSDGFATGSHPARAGSDAARAPRARPGGGSLGTPHGRNTVTVVPSPARLSIPKRPPCASTMRSTIARPRPGPARTRREERIARARAHLRVHSLAGVDDVHREPVHALLGRRAHAHRERAARRPSPARRCRRGCRRPGAGGSRRPRCAPRGTRPSSSDADRSCRSRCASAERALEQIGERELRALHVDRARVAEQIRHQAVQAARLLVEDGEQRLVVLARDGRLAQAGARRWR